MKQSHVSPAALCVLAALGSFACGSSDGNSAAGVGTDKQAATGPCGVGKPTAFAGDQNCIPVPAETEGLQIHVGPSDYDDPDQIWTVAPGGEPTQVYHTYTSNTDDIYFFKQQYRMRPGSHHMIISLSDDTTTPEGWTDSQGNILNTIGGTQHQIEDFPPNGQVAPEDAGLARKLSAKQALDIQLHFYNTTEQPVLREAWVNFLYKPQAEVTQVLGYMGGFVLPLTIAPHTNVTVGGTCDAKNAVLGAGQTTERVVTLFGHTHSHTSRFVVFDDKADGTSDVIYDNYDWSEGSTFTYNSLIKNPVPDPTARSAGAFSGDLILAAGDKLRYQCDIENDLDTSLTFEEKVDTGEMCNLFGEVASPGFPCFDLSKATGMGASTGSPSTQ